jgi:glycosyltransferase involved in cell wall biosynthesis
LCILIENLNREAYEPIVLFLRSPTYQIRKRLGDAGAKVIIMETAARANGSAPQSRGFGLHARLTKFWGGRLVPLYHLARRLRKLFREDIPMAAAMRRELKHIDFDIVHINEGIARGKAGVLLAQSRRVPCICHERMWHECTLLERLFSRLVERMLYNSEAVKDREVAAGIPADKGVVIHNAVDPEEFQVPVDGPCPREEFGWEASHFVVALVGRLDWWKGHEQFILAINETLRRFPQVRALIVGEREVGPRNESYADTLLELQRDLGLEEQLVFTGHRDDVPRIMSDVDAVVLSSSEPEPFGRVVIEGMAAAKPVIATDSGGVPEIIAHRKTGLLIPLKDAHALAGAISELVADPELASALGKAGREEVEKRFTAATQLAKIQSIYEELSAQRRHRRVSTAAAAIE